MRTLVFSDVHGNLPALEILLKKEPADNYIFLGDAVNYGPWSNECVDLINSLGGICILGNHEKYYLSGECKIDGLAREFFNFCYPSFSRINIISRWKENYKADGFIFQHTINDRNIYWDSALSLDDNYIIGHSHHQSYHKYGGFQLYAIGSTGQNREYINRIDYLIIDHRYELKNIIYDESLIINEMISRQYPTNLIEYYSKKPRI